MTHLTAMGKFLGGTERKRCLLNEHVQMLDCAVFSASNVNTSHLQVSSGPIHDKDMAFCPSNTVE